MTCREPQRLDDRTATRLVQLSLPDVDVCLHDDGSQPIMYDLDLRWPDGHVEAMEVTTETAATLRHLGHQLDRQGPVIAKKSTRDWFVWLGAESTDVRSIRANIDHLLSFVERAGITTFGRREERTSVAVARVPRNLGLQYAFSRESVRETPRIVLQPPMRWFRVRPEAINEAVEDHAQRNAQKLGRSGHAERHLFVLMDPPLEAWNALIEDKPPEGSPRLPPEVTIAWAAGYRFDGSPVVWRARRNHAWETLL